VSGSSIFAGLALVWALKYLRIKESVRARSGMTTLPRSWAHMHALAADDQHAWARFLHWMAHARRVVFDDPVEAERSMTESTLFGPEQRYAGKHFVIQLMWRRGLSRCAHPRVKLWVNHLDVREFDVNEDELKQAVTEAVTIKGLDQTFIRPSKKACRTRSC
jgi:hypothetical protein